MRSSVTQVSPTKKLSLYFPEIVYPLLGTSLIGVAFLKSGNLVYLAICIGLMSIPIVVTGKAKMRHKMQRRRKLIRFTFKVAKAMIASGAYTFEHQLVNIKNPNLGTKTQEPKKVCWEFESKQAKSNINNYEIMIRTPHGETDERVQKIGPMLASSLQAWRVTAIPLDKYGIVKFLIQFEDPLKNIKQDIFKNSISIASQPCVIGKNQEGDNVEIELFSQTCLVGGSPGSGKSVMGWVLLRYLASDPTVCLIVCDFKQGVETAPLQYRADFHITTIEAAAEIFAGVLAEISRRNNLLKETYAEKIPKNSTDFPPIVLDIDELAELTRADNENETGVEALNLLTRIVALGRSAGVSVIIKTQKPDNTVIPTGLRDLLGQRCCFRVGSKPQAEVILGPVSSPEIKPWEISIKSPGEGYVISTKGITERFKCIYITREEIIKFVPTTVPARKEFVKRFGQPIKPIKLVQKPPSQNARRK